MKKVVITATFLATIIATPAWPQSYDPDLGPGNVLYGRYYGRYYGPYYGYYGWGTVPYGYYAYPYRYPGPYYYPRRYYWRHHW